MNFLEDFKDVDWGSPDFDDNKVVGNYLPLPDGTPHYIEMSMLHWYWAWFMVNKADEKLENLTKDILEVIDGAAIDPEEFDDLLRLGLMTFGKRWVKNTTGRG